MGLILEISNLLTLLVGKACCTNLGRIFSIRCFFFPGIKRAMFFWEYLRFINPQTTKMNHFSKPAVCNLKIRNPNHPKEKNIPTSIKRPHNSKLKPWGCFFFRQLEVYGSMSWSTPSTSTEHRPGRSGNLWVVEDSETECPTFQNEEM